MNQLLLRRLFSHMEWADAVVWRAVLAEESVGEDEYILDSLTHLHFVQRAYLQVWRREDVVFVDRADFSQPADIRDWARLYYPDARAFLEHLIEAQLEEVIPIPWTEFIEKEIGGPASPATLGDTAFQVTSHSGHHRAQINRRIREVGGSPSMIDYIGWVWRGCPPAVW